MNRIKVNRIRIALSVALVGLVLAACNSTPTPPAVTHKLTLDLTGNGAVVVKIGTDTQTYSADKVLTIDEGSKVDLTANADAGWSFDAWGGACASAANNTCAFTMDADKTVSATFTQDVTPPGQHDLAVTFAQGLGGGAVASGDSSIDCTYTASDPAGAGTGTCSAPFDEGSTVSLTATPDAGSEFAGWGGDCAGATGPTCDVTLSADMAVTARFRMATATDVTSQITAATDDAEEFVSGAAGSGDYTDPGTVDTATGYTEVTYSPNWSTQQVDGFRFPNVTVPAGAEIVSAYVEFTSFAKGGSTGDDQAATMNLAGQLAPDAPTFVDQTDAGTDRNGISGRPQTTATASWDIAAGAWTSGSKHQTSDLAPVLNEIVGLDAWTSGNAIVLIVSDNAPGSTTGYRFVTNADTSATDSPVLHVSYK